ncbi:hypothetical protein KLF26_10865 [Clostridium perfringens]|uniref:hypothetical protein n=1 Tax=Clostridium perfringens TaxID=1502 RepID=UPI001CCBDF05|nr:hypothetical protein [Clostridium perfringens]UBK99700.1 hypothetical protein KLF26_10865 [Clostridium perfringens]
MDREIKKVAQQIFYIIIASVLVFLLGIVLIKQDNNELASMFIGFSGSVIGGVATMLAVYSTLIYDKNQRIKERKEFNEKNNNEIRNKKTKIKIILQNEIDMFFRWVEYDSLIKIKADLLSQKNIFKVSEEIKEINYVEEYSMIDKGFKNLVYEILLLSENDEEIFNCKLLLKFYNEYLKVIEITKKFKNKRNEYIVLVGDFLSNELSDIQQFIDSNIIKVKQLNEELKGTNYEIKSINFDSTNLNKLIDEFNNNIIHYNCNLKELNKFLEGKV